MPFILELFDSTQIIAPTDHQIRLAVMNLRADAEDAAFVILSQSEDSGTYIQAAGDSRSGFALEYQIKDIRNHFSAASDCTAEQVIAAFVAFRNGNDSWRAEHEWEHVLL